MTGIECLQPGQNLGLREFLAVSRDRHIPTLPKICKISLFFITDGNTIPVTVTNIDPIGDQACGARGKD